MLLLQRQHLRFKDKASLSRNSYLNLLIGHLKDVKLYLVQCLPKAVKRTKEKTKSCIQINQRKKICQFLTSIFKFFNAFPRKISWKSEMVTNPKYWTCWLKSVHSVDQTGHYLKWPWSLRACNMLISLGRHLVQFTFESYWPLSLDCMIRSNNM